MYYNNNSSNNKTTFQNNCFKTTTTTTLKEVVKKSSSFFTYHMLKYKPFIAERKERKSLISDKKNLSFFHEKLSQEESSFFSIA